MDRDFTTGGNTFYSPEETFGIPELKGRVLRIHNIDLFYLIKNKSTQIISKHDICVSVGTDRRRLEKADLSYPIWVYEGLSNIHNKKYLMADGKHRFYKQKGETIEAYIFSLEEIKPLIRLERLL